ncbi:MAG TPA: HlyD family efflux transporter periplasmic adaptor subunit [Candidatus Dormibacteraeota bacterium]|nr:HlyD family efflux transporter periplasmic adaptor subunit [Candidatus Dormibacteraeota bacterium]
MDKPSLFFSTAEVSPATVPEPARGPDLAPQDASPPKPGNWRWMMAIALLVAALGVAAVFAALTAAGRSRRGNQTARTALVEQKDFVQKVRVHGIVEAVESHTIAAPRLSGQGLNSLIITKMAKNGSAVHQGDVLVEFDRQAQLKNVLDKEVEYKGLVANIGKKEADQAALRAADETELKKAEDAQKTAELEVKKNEIVSRIDAEKNLQNLEQARATFQQLSQTFDLKRLAAKAELRILEIQRDRALTAMKWAQNNTQKMVVHSSMDGVAVVNSMWKGGSMSDVQEGDEVRAGFPFMQVVNPARMQVRAKVNQADIEALREGQNVRIGLDAYPELSFSGKIASIAAVAQTSAFSGKARTLIVIFSINGTDPKLLPDLSSAVDIELDRQPNALIVPRDTVMADNGKHFVAIKNGSGYEKREVKLGLANDAEQTIVSGVEKGEMLLRNPS